MARGGQGEEGEKWKMVAVKKWRDNEAAKANGASNCFSFSLFSIPFFMEQDGDQDEIFFFFLFLFLSFLFLYLFILFLLSVSSGGRWSVFVQILGVQCHFFGILWDSFGILWDCGSPLMIPDTFLKRLKRFFTTAKGRGSISSPIPPLLKQLTCFNETVGGYAGIVAENKLRGAHHLLQTESDSRRS